jgi:xanthine dehydrogenase large subunit
MGEPLKFPNSHPHDAAFDHVTGRSIFVDDRPETTGEAHVGVIFSPHALARIKNISFEKCKAIEGFLTSVTAKDLKNNLWGSIFHDQPYLAFDTVQFAGEPVAVVAASSRESLEASRRAVQVEYEVLTPLLEIDEAIASKQFIGPQRTIETGDPSKAFDLAPFKLEGTVRIAGQDHFYLESQCSIAYPKEGNQIEIHSSSQHPTEIQHCVAEALGLRFHEVVCTVTRMGGAFGGKESQAAPFAVFAAMVAQKLRKPARIVLTKDDDMVMTGKRNPFLNKYKVGFNSDGKILSLMADLYSDGGAYADLSTAIMERAMLHIDNAYYIPNLKVTGQVCKTNTPPNTAFRGFGGPKGVLTIEKIMEEIAHELGKDSLEIRKVNCYQEKQKTHYGQTIEDSVLPELFQALEKKCHYQDRRMEIEASNQKHPVLLRGLSMTAVKFGISFTTRFLNQGSALVNLHLDGTVQVSTGATEMGQGVNSKIASLVADSFGIPFSSVKVMPTSTEKNANTSATAASSGSDINGRAALDACNQIRTRLQKVAKLALSRDEKLRGRAVAGAGTAPELDFESVKDFSAIQFLNGEVIDLDSKKKMGFAELLQEAYLNRASLSASGFYKYPGIHFDKSKGKGEPFFYFTNGVAATEVSVDRFTGELKVLRSDLLMDLGRPVNEAIDYGQVAGAFVQGMGWLTTENLFYKEGFLMSHSPSTYKIPSVQDIPRVFNCEFFPNDKNEKNLKGSKAVGEPPLLLAISVWTAALDALKNEVSKETLRGFSTPATQEKILLSLRSTN